MTSATVIVGFDGSPGADTAVRWAAGEAARLGARLRIVHAVGLLEHAGLPGVAVDGDAAVGLALHEGLTAGEVEWCVVDGDPCSALLREAVAKETVVLIVVGSRGAGGHAGTLLGSTSLELAEHATVPVTIVPARTPAR